MSTQPCGCDPEEHDYRCGQHSSQQEITGLSYICHDTGATTSPLVLLRQFDTGATRDQETTKYDYEGFLSPLVLERYAAYMHKNRIQKDGSTRDSDNWQRGIPAAAYMKSGFRHFMEWWLLHRGPDKHHGDLYGDRMEEALCGLLFNVMGFLHEFLKGQQK